MNLLRRYRAWVRRPDVAPWFAVFFWSLATLYAYSGVRDFRDRYDARTKTQAARMSCEAKGGFYGSAVGGPKAPERCFKPATQLARADR